MKPKIALKLIGLGTLLLPSPSLARPVLLIVPATFNINGWKVECGGLEGAKTDCMAEHLDAAPYLYLQFWPDRINVAASLDCTHDGYTPAVAVKRAEKPMRNLIGEVHEKLSGPLRMCPNDPMHTEFRTELDDLLALLIRTTATSRSKK
jgi:hypothetical protein